jgi:hypothetical protein
VSTSVEIAESVLRELKASVPQAFWPDLLAQLERLGRNPRLGRRLTAEWGPLTGRMVYVFRVSYPPGTSRFAVVYEFAQDEERLVVTQVVPPRHLRPADGT